MTALTNWRLGTIGFAYPDWAGPFYPRGVAGRARLAWYARSFDTVELDTTFHALPRAEVVEGWAAVVPDGFRFCVKAPRQVTHEGSPGSCAAVDAMARFVDLMSALGERLDVVLLQFPPRFRADRQSALADLLAVLPPGPRYAVEFRDRSWWEPQTADLLRAHATAWVATDEAPRSEAAASPATLPPDAYRPPPIVCTTDFLYVRFIGVHQQFPDVAVERLDPTARLQWWQGRLRSVLERLGGNGVHSLYALFGNGFSGHGPASCARLRHMLGHAVEPPAAPAGQAALFE